MMVGAEIIPERPQKRTKLSDDSAKHEQWKWLRVDRENTIIRTRGRWSHSCYCTHGVCERGRSASSTTGWFSNTVSGHFESHLSAGSGLWGKAWRRPL